MYCTVDCELLHLSAEKGDPVSDVALYPPFSYKLDTVCAVYYVTSDPLSYWALNVIYQDVLIDFLDLGALQEEDMIGSKLRYLMPSTLSGCSHCVPLHPVIYLQITESSPVVNRAIKTKSWIFYLIHSNWPENCLLLP